MIRSLQKMADELHIPVTDPVVLAHHKNSRFKQSEALFFLEQNLFRSRGDQYALKEGQTDISIYSLKNPREELQYIAREIERLVRNGQYRYKDIAIVCGDLQGYANYANEVFMEYQIPVFIDQKTSIIFHPILLSFYGHL